MKNITRRYFRLLCDFMDIRKFMVEIFEKELCPVKSMGGYLLYS